MPGGAKAVTEPWRMALSFVHDAAEDHLADVAIGISDEGQLDVVGVLELLAHGESPVTSSAGRLFDAVAALLGIRNRTTYEGQAAVELEALARRAAHAAHGPDYPLTTENRAGVLVLDPRPLVRAVLGDVRAGTDRATIAAKFHASLGQATAEMAADLAETAGMSTVALSGGVFQNVVFTGIVAGHLEQRGLAVLTHRDIPPNDGGISAGQAFVAASTA
jgi:hydrogenase maturation protein HypF